MIRRRVWGLLIVLLALTPAPAAEQKPPVSVADLRARGVIGDLGEPLGKIVVVTALVVSGDTLRTKDDTGATLLRITRVGERALPAPVQLRVSRSPTLTPGQTVRCAGYETGGFIGAVPHEFDYVQAYATVGFHFATRFVVLKRVE